MVTLAAPHGQSMAAAPAVPVEVELVPRSPEQMSAFYEARGFPPAMVARLARECFITVRIRNTGREVVWLDLAQWRFSADDRPLRRYRRDYWKKKWEEMNIPLASQSTFRWTLLPETLDYQPGEVEGGNVILERTSAPISLEANFDTGPDRKGTPIRLHFDQLRCAGEAP
ncbi:MAG TPA: hypothetical protein ENK05_03945 [Gammaproteobacteria bacterium]|nr:hypothetical protein [Gammaproteobacteria bacterium]